MKVTDGIEKDLTKRHMAPPWMLSGGLVRRKYGYMSLPIVLFGGGSLSEMIPLS